MQTRELIAAFVSVALAFCLLIWFIVKPHTLRTEVRHTSINGVEIHYAVRGYSYGKPVVLLHGNGGSHNDLELMTEQLARAGYRVYAPDTRGQGANAPLSEYHYADMASDIRAFVEQVIRPQTHEGLMPPAVFGWSDGGIIALLSEVTYPGTWAAIITSGANIFPNCGIWDLPKERKHPTYDTPLYKMMLYEPNMTTLDLATIQCPCLIVAGENDAVPREHTELIAGNIPNSELLIVPGADHGSHIVNNTTMGRYILKFFKKIKY